MSSHSALILWFLVHLFQCEAQTYDETTGPTTINCNGNSCVNAVIYFAGSQLTINCNSNDECKGLRLFCGTFDPPGSEYNITDMDDNSVSCEINIDGGLAQNDIYFHCAGDNVESCRLSCVEQLVDSTLECDIQSGSVCELKLDMFGLRNNIICHIGSPCSCNDGGSIYCTDVGQSFVTNAPTSVQTANPTSNPILNPSLTPSLTPTSNPTMTPTNNPTLIPTSSLNPSSNPTNNPSLSPTNNPSLNPTSNPTNNATVIIIMITLKLMDNSLNETKVIQIVEMTINEYLNELSYYSHTISTEISNLIITVELHVHKYVNIEQNILKEKIIAELNKQYAEGSVDLVQTEDEDKQKDNDEATSVSDWEWWHYLTIFICVLLLIICIIYIIYKRCVVQKLAQVTNNLNEETMKTTNKNIENAYENESDDECDDTDDLYINSNNNITPINDNEDLYDNPNNNITITEGNTADETNKGNAFDDV